MITHWEIHWDRDVPAGITTVDSTDTSVTFMAGLVVMYSARSGVSFYYPLHTIEYIRSWTTDDDVKPAPDPMPSPAEPTDPVVVPPPKDPRERSKLIGAFQR